jgi:hypothetical protein
MTDARTDGTDELRSTIVFAFARWTALSALRSGSRVKSRKQIYQLLGNVDFPVLFAASLEPMNDVVFAAWHERAVNTIRFESGLCVGWAAKLVNVYLKTSVYVGGLGRPGLVDAIHPPIDGGLWAGIKKHFGEVPAVYNLTHSKTTIGSIDSYVVYSKIIDGFREAARISGCRLIETEQWWQGAESPSL